MLSNCNEKRNCVSADTVEVIFFSMEKSKLQKVVKYLVNPDIPQDTFNKLWDSFLKTLNVTHDQIVKSILDALEQKGETLGLSETELLALAERLPSKPVKRIIYTKLSPNSQEKHAELAEDDDLQKKELTSLDRAVMKGLYSQAQSNEEMEGLLQKMAEEGETDYLGKLQAKMQAKDLMILAQKILDMGETGAVKESVSEAKEADGWHRQKFGNQHKDFDKNLSYSKEYTQWVHGSVSYVSAGWVFQIFDDEDEVKRGGPFKDAQQARSACDEMASSMGYKSESAPVGTTTVNTAPYAVPLGSVAPGAKKKKTHESRMGGSKKAEIERSARVFKDIAEEQNLSLALMFLMDAGYGREEILSIAEILRKL